MITFTQEEKQRMAEIEEFLRFTHPHPHPIELRTVGGSDSGTIRHLTTSHRALAISAIMAEQTGAAVYYAVNPISASSEYAKTCSTERPIRQAIHTAKDGDILHRANYLIDIDSAHPKGVSATISEKAEALVVMQKVTRFLSDRGWPEPVVIDSGNGYQLIYRGDGCNATSPAWAHVLRHLARRFDTPGARVDAVVHNAARIARMPHTWNRKGPGTSDRPHRLARVLSYPSQWRAVEHGAMIYRLASDTGYTVGSSASTRNSDERPALVDDAADAILAFIAEYPEHLDCAGTFTRGDATYFALRSCPFAGRAHSGHIGKTSIILGSDYVGFSCFSSDCAEFGMSELRELLQTQTGRRSRVRFYQDAEFDPSTVSAAWGGIDDLDEGDRELTVERLLEIVNA